ncbi:hypothetical protein GUJ93_ZPchr0006g45410 [Zizania palustris]|uniref:Tf2-1-like SH3-like domain-containing protein n=1 Tax=Zizania palustris TaxID=103762 RepID=A0A8J5S5X7_ZIZPA|nr:hypothetical protein GUJ93_ZPchr0006g45410 [Zizania palustris]
MSSLPRTTTGKLKPRFVGPYRVVKIINTVAVRLELPLGARLHDVFHVGVLKKFVGAPLASPPALLAIHDGAVIPEPLSVEQACFAWRASGVCFLGRPRRVPHQVFLVSARGRAESRGGRRDVMWGRTYRRRCDVRRATERAARAREEASTGG